MSVVELGPAQVTIRLNSGMQIEMDARATKLEVVEEVFDHFSGFGGGRVLDRSVAINRSITATFDVAEFDIVGEPEAPTPEVKQKLDLIRMIRF